MVTIAIGGYTTTTTTTIDDDDVDSVKNLRPRRRSSIVTPRSRHSHVTVSRRSPAQRPLWLAGALTIWSVFEKTDRCSLCGATTVRGDGRWCV